MNLIEYKDLLRKAIPAKRRVLTVGKPGVGKTHAVMQVCAELGYDLIVMCLPLDDPSTIRGYPLPPSDPEGDAVHCLFDGMARAFKATRPTVLFFDDIGQASESTLKSVMRVIQFGELDGRKLPDCVVILGATNDVGHGAGVYGMIEPLKSRWHSIVRIDCDPDAVALYGLQQGWPIWLVAFIRNDPEALNTWKPSKSMLVDGSCPRGIEYVAQWDNIGVEDSEVWAGCVGKDIACKMREFKRIQAQLPDISQIEMDPENAMLPDDAGARFLVTTTIASKMNGDNFGQFLKYLHRLPQTFRAYSVRDAFTIETANKGNGRLRKGHKLISQSRDYTAWVLSSDGKEILSSVKL